MSGPRAGSSASCKKPGIASIAANRLDRQLRLSATGSAKKSMRLGEGFGDQLCVDTVIDDIEEADVAARCADLRGDPVQRGPIAFAR